MKATDSRTTDLMICRIILFYAWRTVFLLIKFMLFVSWVILLNLLTAWRLFSDKPVSKTSLLVLKDRKRNWCWAEGNRVKERHRDTKDMCKKKSPVVTHLTAAAWRVWKMLPSYLMLQCLSVLSSGLDAGCIFLNTAVTILDKWLWPCQCFICMHPEPQWIMRASPTAFSLPNN